MGGVSITLHPVLAEKAGDLGLGPATTRYRCRPNIGFLTGVGVLVFATVVGVVAGMNAVVWWILAILTVVLLLSCALDHLARRQGGLYVFENGVAAVHGPAMLEAHLRWDETSATRWETRTFLLVVNLVPIPFWRREFHILGARDGRPAGRSRRAPDVRRLEVGRRGHRGAPGVTHLRSFG
jgi:hypothetical protein